MSLDVLVRVAANGFVLLFAVGLVISNAVFLLSPADLTLLALIVGIIVEPLLIHNHPFKRRTVLFYEHLKTILRDPLATLGARTPPDRDAAKLQGAFIKALYEYAIRTDKTVERFAAVVSKQTRSGLFYVLTYKVLLLVAMLALPIAAIRFAASYRQPVDALEPLVAATLSGVEDPYLAAVYAAGLTVVAILGVIRFRKFAALQYLVEFDYLDTYITMNGEKLKRMAEEMLTDQALLDNLASPIGFDFIAFLRRRDDAR